MIGKRGRKDVQEFGRNLMANLISLYQDLAAKTYQHSAYKMFMINDPKRRIIHKVAVRDRVLHRAIYRILYHNFDRRFIHDSYSCRNGKGTHKALDRFQKFSWQLSRNNTRRVWVLKCDIGKFFASIDHIILLGLISKHIPDKDVNWLIGKVIDSFHSTKSDQGLPLGNLTSQLFANVYLNELDQFIKHQLKVKYYIRYADDFAILSHDRNYLGQLLLWVREFLAEKLKLDLHPDKAFIKTLSLGVDFLGWTHFPSHRVLRMVTKKRMFRKIELDSRSEVVRSYLGLLEHGNGKKLQNTIAIYNQTVLS